LPGTNETITIDIAASQPAALIATPDFLDPRDCVASLLYIVLPGR
jgi:hypothetical protein